MNSVANVRTRDYIINNIREQILSGAFPAGMRLAQEELAEGLGVSRIPVREALQILEEQGLIKRLPSRHMVVIEMTGLQFHQIFQTIGGLQYHYSRFILASAAREGFLTGVSDWNGTDEMAFHRLFSVWLDNEYLSRQFHTMLDTYVEYACHLSGQGRCNSSQVLLQIQEALVKEEDRTVLKLLQQYYGILEECVLEERTRHICKD